MGRNGVRSTPTWTLMTMIGQNCTFDMRGYLSFNTRSGWTPKLTTTKFGLKKLAAFRYLEPFRCESRVWIWTCGSGRLCQEDKCIVIFWLGTTPLACYTCYVGRVRQSRNKDTYHLNWQSLNLNIQDSTHFAINDLTYTVRQKNCTFLFLQ